MFRHTTGPWHVTTVPISIRDDKGKQIASLDSEGSPDIDYDESLANAYLIAAAPEMLAVLKDVLGEIDDRKLIDRVFTVIGEAEGDGAEEYYRRKR